MRVQGTCRFVVERPGGAPVARAHVRHRVNIKNGKNRLLLQMVRPLQPHMMHSWLHPHPTLSPYSMKYEKQ